MHVIITCGYFPYQNKHCLISLMIWKWLRKWMLSVAQTSIQVDNFAAFREKISWLIKLGFCSRYLPKEIIINQIWIGISNYVIFSALHNFLNNPRILNSFTLNWSRNVLHNPMWNMAVNSISYSIYLLSTKIEKGYTTKIIPFFFCSVYEAKWPRVTVA